MKDAQTRKNNYFVYCAHCYTEKKKLAWLWIRNGITIDTVPYYEWIKLESFEWLTDAEKFLKLHPNKIEEDLTGYRVTEYFITTFDKDTAKEGDLFEILRYGQGFSLKDKMKGIAITILFIVGLVTAGTLYNLAPDWICNLF